MRAPAFFDTVAPIEVADPLAALLGAAEDGLIEYRYLDAVKLAGHSCPTVAGAWLMTRKALARLYPDGTPQRGSVQVELRQAADEGVAGVIASIACLLTGAANEGGFKGLGGRFGRQGLLRFGVPMAGEIRFTRLDTGRSLPMAAMPSGSPGLMRDALAPHADVATRQAFAETWQDWVRTILLDHGDDPALIAVIA